MNAYPDTRWIGLQFKFEFIDQKARQDATPSSSAQYGISQIRQVIDDVREYDTAYVGLDHNRWGLSRNFKLLPDTITRAQTGWMGNTLSNASCRFTSYPYLEFSFTEPHSSIGFSIHFDEMTGSHATSFLVQTFNASGAVLTSKTVENHSALAIVNLLSPDYTRVRFTFYEMSRPYTRLRISEVMFGIVELFDPSSTASASLRYQIDPIAESLPSREAIIRIDNSDQRFNLINPNGIYAYLQQPQSFFVSLGVGDSKDTIEMVPMGEFYFATASAEDSGLTAEICAYDWFYWLEKGKWLDTATGQWTLQQAVTAILANAGIKCDVVIPSAVRNIPIYHVSEEMTNREALRQAVQAACCTAYFDLDSRLVIVNLSQRTPVDILDSDNMTMPPKVSIESAVNTVQLTTHNPSTDEDVVYTAENLSSPDELTQLKTVTNHMVHTSKGQAVANWLLALCQGRVTYHTTERGNPATRLTDTVKIFDYFGVNRSAVIISQDFTYNGGLSEESEAISIG